MLTSTQGPRTTDHMVGRVDLVIFLLKSQTLRVSKGYRRGIAGIAIFTQNCDQSVQIRQLGTFLPQFGHNISTLRKHFESTSKGKVSKQKTAYTKGSKGITWVIYLLRKPFTFSAQLVEKTIFTLLGVATLIQGNYHDDRGEILGQVQRKAQPEILLCHEKQNENQA